jgi:hypothetical protein
MALTSRLPTMKIEFEQFHTEQGECSKTVCSGCDTMSSGVPQAIEM